MTTIIGLIVFVITLYLSIALFSLILDDAINGKNGNMKVWMAAIVSILWTFLLYWYN